MSYVNDFIIHFKLLRFKSITLRESIDFIGDTHPWRTIKVLEGRDWKFKRQWEQKDNSSPRYYRYYCLKVGK